MYITVLRLFVFVDGIQKKDKKIMTVKPLLFYLFPECREKNDWGQLIYLLSKALIYYFLRQYVCYLK